MPPRGGSYTRGDLHEEKGSRAATPCDSPLLDYERATQLLTYRPTDRPRQNPYLHLLEYCTSTIHMRYFFVFGYFRDVNTF